MKKAFLCILGSVLLLLAAIWGGIRYRTRYEVVLLDSSFSPDGEYTLTLASVGEPDWPFGSARGRITLKQNEKQLSRTEIDIADDGCQLGKEHWSVVWQDTHAAVTLRASEQPDEHWRFYFDGQVLQLPGLPAAAAPTQRPRTQEAGGTPASEERVTLPVRLSRQRKKHGRHFLRKAVRLEVCIGISILKRRKRHRSIWGRPMRSRSPGRTGSKLRWQARAALF